MNIRSKAIWITAAIIMGTAAARGSLDLIGILVIFIIAKILDRIFGDHPAPTQEQETKVVASPGKHLITTDGVKQIRNLLLKHHNMKQTDKDYTNSAMAENTVAIVAMLNVFLKGK